MNYTGTKCFNCKWYIKKFAPCQKPGKCHEGDWNTNYATEELLRKIEKNTRKP